MGTSRRINRDFSCLPMDPYQEKSSVLIKIFKSVKKTPSDRSIGSLGHQPSFLRFFPLSSSGSSKSSTQQLLPGFSSIGWRHEGEDAD